MIYFGVKKIDPSLAQIVRDELSNCQKISELLKKGELETLLAIMASDDPTIYQLYSFLEPIIAHSSEQY